MFQKCATLGLSSLGPHKKRKKGLGKERKTETLPKIKPLSLVFTQWGES